MVEVLRYGASCSWTPFTHEPQIPAPAFTALPPIYSVFCSAEIQCGAQVQGLEMLAVCTNAAKHRFSPISSAPPHGGEKKWRWGPPDIPLGQGAANATLTKCCRLMANPCRPRGQFWLRFLRLASIIHVAFFRMYRSSGLLGNVHQPCQVSCNCCLWMPGTHGRLLELIQPRQRGWETTWNAWFIH